MIYVSHFFNLGPINKAAQHINTEPAYHHCTSLTLSLGQALFKTHREPVPGLLNLTLIIYICIFY